MTDRLFISPPNFCHKWEAKNSLWCYAENNIIDKKDDDAIAWLTDFTKVALRKFKEEVDIKTNLVFKCDFVGYLDGKHKNGSCHVWILSNKIKICLASSDKDGYFSLNLLYGESIPIFCGDNKDKLVEQWFNAFWAKKDYLMNKEDFTKWLSGKGDVPIVFKWVMKVCHGIRKSLPGSNLFFDNELVWIRKNGKDVYCVGDLSDDGIFYLDVGFNEMVKTKPWEKAEKWIALWIASHNKLDWDIAVKMVSSKNFIDGLPDWLTEEEKKFCIEHYYKGYEINISSSGISGNKKEKDGLYSFVRCFRRPIQHIPITN